MKALALSLLIFSQGQLSFRSPSGAFELWNFDRVFWEAPKAGDQSPTMHAEVNGAPYRLRWRDRGIDLTGRTATVDADRGQNGEYFLTHANLAGGVNIVQDTALADAFLAERANAAGGTAPVSNPSPSSLKLVTDALSYAGDVTTGTLTIPGAFDVETKSHRSTTVAAKGNDQTRLSQVIDETTTIHGASGTVTFATEMKDANSLRTALAATPAVRLVRTTITDGKPDPATDVTASADTMSLDFKGAEHTITLTGNVVVNGTSDVYAGYTKAAKAVIFFGADGKIARIEMTGSPTETNIRPRPATGGGR